MSLIFTAHHHLGPPHTPLINLRGGKQAGAGAGAGADAGAVAMSGFNSGYKSQPPSPRVVSGRRYGDA